MVKKDTRQSTKENLRLFLLDSLFQQDRFYTKEELVAKLEVSVPTLDRDLRRLRDDYSAPLEYCKVNGGYHYTSRLFKLPAVFAPDKKVEPYTGDHVHKDGAVLVTFTSNQPLGIIRAFFPYGEDIIPLAPQSFVDEWTDNVRKMAKSLGI